MAARRATQQASLDEPVSFEIRQTSGRANLSQARWFIHGPGKVGKSTFASGWPGVFFLATEQRLEHIPNVRYAMISNWSSFKAANEKIRDPGFRQQFRTIVVDVIDLLYQQCLEYVKGARGFEHPSDAGYGKGYDLVDTEFKLEFFKLLAAPYALIFVSHTQVREITTVNGTITRQVSTLPDRIKKIILPHMGVIAYITPEVKEVNQNGQINYIEVPVLKFEGSSTYEAGDGEGCLPPEIPMYRDPRRTFQVIAQYYQRGPRQASPAN